MKKFKLDKNTSIRLSSLSMAGIIFLTSITLPGCTKNNSKQNTAIVTLQSNKESTERQILHLFPTLSKDVVKNTSIVTLLDDIAIKEKNGKINPELMSNFKSKVDVDNMMEDFYSFINLLEETMLNDKKTVSVSNLVLNSDSDIMCRIEKITNYIIAGDYVEANAKLIYELFVEGKDIRYDGLTFKIDDLSYSGRAIASAYARTALNYSKGVLTEEEIKNLDDRTNDQNNKAEIKTCLEVIANQMTEKSETNINKLFVGENEEIIASAQKVNLSDENLKNLVSYINLGYLDSDRVSTDDKNSVLGEYSDRKIKNVLLTIDAITEYNMNNKNNIVLLSNNLVDNYKETESGYYDTVALDYIQFNSIMFLNTTTKDSTQQELFNNPYFQNLYDYFRKADITHKYPNKEVNVAYQNISEGVKFVLNEIVFYTINKRPNIKNYEGYEEKLNSNLVESVNYIESVITGDCKKTFEIDNTKIK